MKFKRLFLAIIFSVTAILPFAAFAQDFPIEYDPINGTHLSHFNFDLAIIGNFKEKTVTVTNISAQEVPFEPQFYNPNKLASPEGATEFTIHPPKKNTIGPNESLSFTVEFAPTKIGSQSTAIVFGSDTHLFDLSGTGVEDTNSDYYSYKVEAGDTFTSIAASFNMSKGDLMADNGYTSPSALIADTIIKIYKSKINNPDLGTKIGTQPQPEPTTPEIKFTDITNHWASPFIIKLFQQGIVKGRTETIFDPNATVNRAELAKMVVLAAKLTVNADEKKSSFVDVPDGHWAIPYIEAAYREGIIEGYQIDGQKYFKPANDVVRAEALKMILFAAGYKDTSYSTPTKTFPDVPADSWFAKYVYFAVEKEFAAGYVDGTFKPADPLTRGGAAKFICLIFGLITNPTPQTEGDTILQLRGF